jgi:ketosteroid isomerase-like protein
MQANFTTALQCETAFYTAFNNCDLDLMMRVWASDTPIFCVHPGDAALHGRGSVISSWRKIFAGAGELNFSVSGSRIVESDTLIVRFVHENIRHGPGRRSLSVVLATNVFVRENDEWKLCSHHASAAPAQADASLLRSAAQGSMH